MPWLGELTIQQAPHPPTPKINHFSAVFIAGKRSTWADPSDVWLGEAAQQGRAHDIPLHHWGGHAGGQFSILLQSPWGQLGHEVCALACQWEESHWVQDQGGTHWHHIPLPQAGEWCLPTLSADNILIIQMSYHPFLAASNMLIPYCFI